MAEDSKVIYAFSKNVLEEVRISISTFKGRKYVDIRVYYKSEDDGSFKPSKKGITLAPNLLSELIQGIKMLEEELKEEMENHGASF